MDLWTLWGKESVRWTEKIALTYIYTLLCVTQIASGKLLYVWPKALSLELWDDLEGWDGGGEEDSRGKWYMYTHSWFPFVIQQKLTQLWEAITLQLKKENTLIKGEKNSSVSSSQFDLMFVSVVSSKIWCGMGGQQETAYMVVERCIVSVEASRTCYIESSPATLLLPRAAPPTMNSMLACSQCTVKSDSLQPHGGVPWDSSVHGILQARILEWVAISSSRGYSWSRIKPPSPLSPALAGGFFQL